MQSRKEPITNTVNERSFISASASSPITSRAAKALPADGGGVCGSSSEKAPSASDAIAAMRIGVAVASTPSVPRRRPTAIQPSVPRTRTDPNSAAGSFRLLIEIELVSESVGM